MSNITHAQPLLKSAEVRGQIGSIIDPFLLEHCKLIARTGIGLGRKRRFAKFADSYHSRSEPLQDGNELGHVRRTFGLNSV